MSSYYTDGYRLCCKTDRPGKSPVIDIFNDRRAALTWPGPKNDGYFCIFGLQDVVTHRDKAPLVLMVEGSFKDQDQMFSSIITHMRSLDCSKLYGDCSQEFRNNEIAFDRFVRRWNAKGIGLYDTSEFDGYKSSYGGFKAARAPIDEHGRDGLLKIHPNTQLASDLQVIQDDDYGVGYTWERFPALNAFNYIIMSYVISPWEKPERTWQSGHMRSEGYGG